jgi:RNase P subunit RPR2
VKEIHVSSVKRKIEGAVCPKCKRPASGATGMGNDEHPQPEPGNLVVCLYCGALSRYDAKLHPQPVAREERRRILRRDPRLRELVELAEWVTREKRREWQ